MAASSIDPTTVGTDPSTAKASRPAFKAAIQGFFGGASFLQLEPGLVKEAGLNSREMSGWAMGGSSLSD